MRRRLLRGIAVGAAGIVLAVWLLGSSTYGAAPSPGAGSLNPSSTTRELPIQSVASPAAPVPSAPTARDETAPAEFAPTTMKLEAVMLRPTLRRQLAPEVRDEKLAPARRSKTVEPSGRVVPTRRPGAGTR